MSCSCGHHDAPAPDVTGTPLEVTPMPIAVHGRLICADMAQMLMALDLLPDHASASRAEPGCLRFDLAQSDDPMVWTLSEVFADDTALEAHRRRTEDSAWGRDSRAIGRDLHRHPAPVLIRPEVPADHAGIDALLARAFSRQAEAQLLRDLRADGDLTLSLVAHAGGAVLGHVALSRLAADRPALALAPLAVHPAMQRRGIGRALIAAAIAHADAPVVVLGDPALYAPAGFRPANLASPYAGPALLVHGTLPPGTAIAHAPAFSRL